MTLDEVRNQINALLPDNTVQEITPAKLRAILLLIAQAIDEGGFEP